MKFEYIILLILAFNVVTALIKKRKAEAESRPRPAPRPADARDELARPRDARAEGAAPKKNGMGRDLLEQLAKELGLETDAREGSRPEPSPWVPEATPEVVIEAPAPPRPPRKRASPAVAAIPKVEPPPAASRVAAPSAELRDLEGLRRAMIAREILGPPVSRR